MDHGLYPLPRDAYGHLGKLGGTRLAHAVLMGTASQRSRVFVDLNR
jgi:hypothetical protein